ncbi:hypothetical protein NDU88_002645 [Pleurodeles waltl]|uniref:Uncharacterized protein n=1 Tax=Pleurodeles waltl TaxID=8319 RepID=A0AAV7TL75_PLEWA|nr:hypothetical protein NDU88_002645 [Pleurodeles waltl]
MLIKVLTSDGAHIRRVCLKFLVEFRKISVKNHTPEPAEQCPRGTLWGTTYPEVLSDPDIWVKDTERGEKGKPERKHSLEPEDETRREPEDKRSTEPEERKGTEPEENGREESGERRGNPAPSGSLKRDPETPTELDGRHDQRRHVSLEGRG